MIQHLVLAAFLFGAALLQACAETQPPTSGEDWALLADSGVKTETKPEATPASAALTIPAEGIAMPTLSVNVAGEIKSKSADGQLRQVSTRVVNGAKVMIRNTVGPLTGDMPDPPKDGNLLEMDIDAEGNLRLSSVTDFVDSMRSEFNPPLIAMPATLKLNAPVTSEFKMIVRPSSDLTKEQTSGTGQEVITLQGIERVRTPAGEFDALKVTSLFTATLGPARVRTLTTTWYVPGKGAAIESDVQRVTALGIPVRSQNRTWITQSFGPLEPAAKQK